MATMDRQVIGDRYEFIRKLGLNIGRQTVLARDRQTDRQVVIKLLSFTNEFEWDYLKLFEREVATLQSLDHPAIPKLLDYFEINHQFGLVQSYIEGNSLQDLLDSGHTFSAAEIEAIAHKILDILVYLHGRNPPIVHRDIKPSNILLRETSNDTVGDLYLVDFGSVQISANSTRRTITVIGTYGYMPPEQFGGQTVPASDLYSLGATLVALAAHAHPADLPQKNLKIQLQPTVQLNSNFIAWLDRLIQPDLQLRFASSKVAKQHLDQLTPSTQTQRKQLERAEPIRTAQIIDELVRQRNLNSKFSTQIRSDISRKTIPQNNNIKLIPNNNQADLIFTNSYCNISLQRKSKLETIERYLSWSSFFAVILILIPEIFLFSAIGLSTIVAIINNIEKRIKTLEREYDHSLFELIADENAISLFKIGTDCSQDELFSQPITDIHCIHLRTNDRNELAIEITTAQPIEDRITVTLQVPAGNRPEETADWLAQYLSERLGSPVNQRGTVLIQSNTPDLCDG